VRRVATERNMGLLHRMAAAQQGGGGSGMSNSHNGQPSNNVARSDFYTIRSHDRVEEDEFVDQDVPQAATAVVDESAELEALKAVTDQAASVYGSSSGAGASSSGGPIKSYVAGGGGPNNNGRGGGPPQFGKPPPHMMMSQGQGQMQRPSRPNADPELRQQELPKKKTTTGIPRTFLSLNAPAPTPAEGDGTTELASGDAENGEATAGAGGGLASQLNPNQHVFQALINRAGGQSMGDSAGKRRDLDYALKLTATSIPEHLQCGICHSVVKNAMLIPWDPEGRPTCESCIRDALAKNGFKCPLTGTEGVSPDDLLKNVGLRKAAELFVEDIMQQMDQIEKQLEAEEAEEEKRNALAKENEESNVFEGVAGEGGTLLTRKTAAKAGGGKKSHEDDLFGGGDDFGGDVFDVAEDDIEDEDENMTDEPVTNEYEAPKSSGDKVDDNNNTKTETTDATVSSATDPIEPSSNEKKSEEDAGVTKKEDDSGAATNEVPENNSKPSDDSSREQQHEKNDSSHNLSTNTAPTSSRRRNEAPKRRGPPAGYMLGPAGASAGPSPNKFPRQNNVPPPPPPRGAPMMGRGPPGGNYSDTHYGGGRGRGYQNFGRGNNDWNRKRDFNQMDDGGMHQHQEMNQGGWGGGQRDNYGGRGNPHYQGRGNPHYQGGGGRGRFGYDGGGRGDGYRGGRGRGNFRGGGRGYRGRGRW